MPISRYPRPGQPIVPRLVHEFLQDEGVPGFQGLKATNSNRQDESTRRRLARSLLHELAARWPVLVRSLESRPVSPHPRTVAIDDLQLENRTFNCLDRAGIHRFTTGTEGVTIGELLHLKGFGLKSLVDLLVSLEASAPADSKRRQQDGSGKSPAARSRKLPAAARDGAVSKRIRNVTASMSALPGALAIAPADPRVGRQFRAAVHDATTLGAALDALRDGRLSGPSTAALLSLCEEVQTLDGAKLEDELVDILAAGRSQRDRQVVAACLKWQGNRRATNTSVGKQFDITYERVRQVFCRWLPRSGGPAPFAPTLDRALEIVRADLPAPLAEVERRLARSRLTKGRVPVAGIRELATLMGREPGFVIHGHGERRSVVSEAELGSILQLQSRARQLVTTVGLTTVKRATDTPAAAGLSPSAVMYALRSLEGFYWLDESEGTFSLRWSRPNVLWNRIRKVLAVCPRISADVLWLALQHDDRYPGQALTRAQLLDYCRRQPGWRVAGKFIMARHPENPLDVLQGHEREIVRLLIEHGPLPRRELASLAAEAGIEAPSYGRCLQSPAISRYGLALYGVTGSVPLPTE